MSAALCISLVAQANAADEGLSLRQMLLMPGKLIKGHAELEGECDNCHASFDKANQSPLCLDCHEDVAGDVTAGRRLHGRIASGDIPDCVSCHSDHEGRDADITGLDRDHFDHGETDFPLAGRHASLHCTACHSDGTRFREASSHCAGCHDDVHEGALGDDCKSCHEETGWTPKVFDHESTGFPLSGTHADVACSGCHLDQRFEGVPPECVACHLGKDRHLGAYGRQCESCHVPRDWNEVRFDHRSTNFPLEGHHANLACAGCHRPGLEMGLPITCADCHAADDVHRKANGEECAECHDVTDWRTVRFDHETDTNFPLVGAHREVPCASCHAGGSAVVPAIAPRVCVDCHGPLDPHQAQLGEACEQCHGQAAWDQDVLFSHDFSVFPLTGAHQGLPCAGCHFSAAYQDVEPNCPECHIGDDVHESVFGDACADCHNTAAWMSWAFDHDSATAFPLTGAHVALACGLCHEKDARDPVHPSQRCVACHGPDDVHRGSLGPDCSRCHGTEAFDQER